MKRIFLLTILLLAPLAALAHDNDKIKETVPIDNGYPYFITTSVFPLNQGLLEWTIAPVYTHANDERNLLLLPQVAYGITDSWLIAAAFIPYMIHWEKNIFNQWESNQGIGDINLGTQYSWLYIKKTQCSASVFFNVTLPSGDVNKGLSDGMIHYTPSFILSKDFIHNNWRTQLFMQAAVSFVQRAQRPRDPLVVIPAAHDFIFNGGIAERSEKINYSLEFNWITNTWNHDGNNDEKYLTPGVYVYVNKAVAVGLGVPIGLTQSSDKFLVIGNLLVDIETIFKKKDDSDKDKDKDKKKGAASRSSLISRTVTSSSSTIPLSSPHATGRRS